MRGDVLPETVQRLLQAVRSGDSFTLQGVLEAHRGFPALTPHLNHALCNACACRTTSADIIRLLLRSKPEVTRAFADGRRPLHYAAASGNVEAAKLLLNAGTPLSVVDSQGASALHRAIEAGHNRMVALLLQEGATANRPRTYQEGMTPLHVASRLGRTDAVRMLLRKGADVRSINKLEAGGCSALHLAVRGRHFSTVQVLCTADAAVNQTDARGSTPLHDAIKNLSQGCVRILLEHNADPDQVNKQGQAPLHLAASASSASDMVGLLLANGATANKTSPDKYNALHYCGISGNADAASQLLSAGADPLQPAGPTGETPLHLAITHGKDDVALALISSGTDVNVSNKVGITPLHSLPISRVVDKAGVLDALLAAGARVNTFCSLDTYPLDRCAFSVAVGGAFCRPVLYRLVAAGAKLEKNPRSSGSVLRRSSLCWLTMHGEMESARFLVNAGWDLQQERNWLLQPARDDTTEDFLCWVRDVLCNPASLRKLCRASIRTHLGITGKGIDLVMLIGQLPLPGIIKGYLRLDNEVSCIS